MAPKKNIKMDLGSFLADDSLGGGSWADEEVDMSSIGVAAVPGAGSGISDRQGGGDFGRQGFSQGSGDFRGGDRKEFPIPDAPPYRARINNLPWDIVDEDVKEFFEKRMQMNDIITDIALPLDRETGKLRGFGFITFAEREVLEEALRLSLSDFNGRRIFVNVAAPQKDGFDDWRSGAGGSSRRRDEDVDLDWGAAREERVGLPPRERSFRDRPRREEQAQEFDWGSAREEHSGLPPRERSFRPRREEQDFDWGSAREEKGGLPPRERFFRDKPKRDDVDLDWGSARTEQAYLPPRERRERSNRKPRTQEPELDWGSARTEQVAPAPRSRNASNRFNKSEEKKEEVETPKRSAFDVLAVESDSEDEVKAPAKEESKEESQLEQATANLSISKGKEDKEEGWEVVGK